jgi:hypothetical protein
MVIAGPTGVFETGEPNRREIVRSIHSNDKRGFDIEAPETITCDICKRRDAHLHITTDRWERENVNLPGESFGLLVVDYHILCLEYLCECEVVRRERDTPPIMTGSGKVRT